MTGHLLKYQSILDNYTGTIKNIMKYRLQYEQHIQFTPFKKNNLNRLRKKIEKLNYNWIKICGNITIFWENRSTT